MLRLQDDRVHGFTTAYITRVMHAVVSLDSVCRYQYHKQTQSSRSQSITRNSELND